MNRRHWFLLGCAALAAVAGLGAVRFRELKPHPTANRGPVIVELFTSEGCSSCPSAEALLSRIEREQPYAGRQVVVLEEHVDYWNSAAWSDRFSSRLFTERQEAYAKILNPDGPYTPQAVVNGTIQFVGSDEDKLTDAITNGAPNVAPLAVRLSSATVSWDVATLPKEASVFVAVAESGLSSEVHGGENQGAMLRHASVVRLLKRLDATQTQTDVQLDPSWKRQNLTITVFAQDLKTGRILAAGTAPYAKK